MPIGNSYPRDVVIEDADLFLGTKASLNNTVNYTAQGIANYLNINGKVSITGQMSFKFVEVNNITKTISFEGGGGNNTPFSNITQLIVSKSDLSGQQVEIFLAYLNGKEILLAHQNEINSFGNYKITGYTVTINPGFYTLDLEFIGGNGVIIKNSYYDMVAFSSSTGGTPYTLPIASLTILGGVKIGTGVNIAVDGMISVSTNYQAPLSGSGIVKSTSGTISYILGTSSQFVKGDGSLDSSVYLTGITSSDVTTALGYTPVTNARTLTINGVGYDLTANRSWTISTSTSPLTTKGDLYTFSTVDARLPLGSNTQILTVDTSTATGLKWAAPPAATPLGYYGAFQDLLTQTLAVANVGQPFLIRTLDEANQVSITANGSGQLTRITPLNTGVYNIQWSGQFQNPTNDIHNVNVWFRRGLVSSSAPGTDISGSNGIIALPARKSSVVGEEGRTVSGWNFLLSIAAGEYVEFYWMSNSTQITLQAYATGNPPPSTASLIVTVTQQSGIMAGTGITAINSSTGAAQTLTVGTTGTDFAIVDSGVDHKFNLPTASASNRGALSSTDWSTFNNKQNALGYTPIKSVVKDTVQGTTITGVTTETLTGTYLIPANTFATNDIMKITSFLAEKTGVVGTCTMRVKVGTTAAFGSATLIAIYITNLTSLWCILQRMSISLKNGVLKTININSGIQTDINASVTVISSITFNPAVDNYIFTSLQLSNITDSIFQSNFIVTN